MAHTVIMKHPYIRKELVADAVVKPGHVVKRSSATNCNLGNTGSKDVCLVVGEMEVPVGDNYGNIVEKPYAVGDYVFCHRFGAGGECKLLVAVGAAAITAGDMIKIAADGTAAKGTSADAFAIAVEDVDNSAGTKEVFLQVEVL